MILVANSTYFDLLENRNEYLVYTYVIYSRNSLSSRYLIKNKNIITKFIRSTTHSTIKLIKHRGLITRQRHLYPVTCAYQVRVCSCSFNRVTRFDSCQEAMRSNSVRERTSVCIVNDTAHWSFGVTLLF